MVGRGGSCIVYRGELYGRPVAVKEMDMMVANEHQMKEFRRETSTLTQMKPHPNLVALVGLTYSEKKAYLVIEFCEGGSLFELIHRNTEQLLTLPQQIDFIKQIAKGMEFLHSFGLVHRDLKSLKYAV